MRTRLALLLLFVASTADASPNIPLDDPIYERLAVLRALGRLPLYLGGIRPLTEFDAQRLLLQAAEQSDPTLPPVTLRGLWFTPARRVIARLGLFSDEERPYSTPDRPVGMIGGVQVSCEHQEGRPCGQGGGVLLELDSAAGFGHHLSAFTRLQFMFGSNEWSIRGALDRAYINGEYGPVAIEIGRDVLALGPGVHTQLIWGDNPAPLDHVRIQTAHPLKIPKIPVTFSGLYAFGLLRDPQTFHRTQVTITRLAIAIADQLELGAQQLLQLNGDGAAHFGFGDFIAEHFTRKYPFLEASNRRASLEATYTNRWARGLRIYYELAFEDFRKNVVDMFLYDCDHLLGFDMPALTRSGHHGLVLELQHNGPFSQQHNYFTTGMTNAGRVVGTPLGPDSWDVYAAGRIDTPWVRVYPWVEYVREASGIYNPVLYGPVLLVSEGLAEHRFRIGTRARARFHSDLDVELTLLFEHVENYAFRARSTANNGGASVSMTWSMTWPSKTARH